MKVLIFTGGNQPDLRNVKKYIADYDVAITADSGLKTAEALGIFPDYITGDMDSLDDKKLLKKYDNSKITIFPQDKDFTDTELAVQIAEEHNASEIIFIGAGGGRADHFFYFFNNFMNTPASHLWLHDSGVGFCLDSKKIKCLKLNDIQNAYISIFSQSKHGQKILSKGLFWNIDTLDWENGAASLSNKQRKSSSGAVEPIELKPEEGKFLVLLSPFAFYDFTEFFV